MAFEYRNASIKLISCNEDGLVEITEEGVDYLNSLANEKISVVAICSPSNQDNSSLLNSFLKEGESFLKEKEPGIYIWATPIELENKAKLLILDGQCLEHDKETSKKLFLLSVLMSTCFIFNTNEIDNDLVKLLSEHVAFAAKLSIEDVNEKTDLQVLGEEHFPQFIWTINNFNGDNNKEGNIFLEEELSKYPDLTKDFKKLFQKRGCDFFPKTSFENFITGLKEKLKPKKIKSFDIDGESLFGVTQNYIDALNNEEMPVLLKALENILLSKGKNISEQVFSDFKIELNANLKDKYPLSYTEIYKQMFELSEKYFADFSKKVETTLTVPQCGDYLTKISQMAQNELDNIFELNKDYYEEWYDMTYKELEKSLANLGTTDEQILFENLGSFYDSYFTEVQNCLAKFTEIPNPDYMKIMISVINKIVQEVVFIKVKKIGEHLNDKHQNFVKDSNAKIEELTAQIKKQSEQISSDKKTLETKLNEKSEINRTCSELQNKNDKLLRELKAKEKDNENNIIISNQKYNKMETYYKNQITDKDNVISQLEGKIEKINKESQDVNRENTNKINELNREILKLQFEIERLKGQEKKGKTEVDCGGLNIQTLFKNVQSTFMEFKESIDKLESKNDNIFKAKFLEHSSKEIETKSKSWIDEIKNYKESQIKALSENYEKAIKKTKEEVEELNFELTKKDYSLQEQTQLKENFMNKCQEAEEKLKQNNDLQVTKDGLISTQNESIKMLESQLNNMKTNKENLEMSLNTSIVESKMKDDEMENLIFVIEAMSQKKRDKYETFLNKLSPDVKAQVEKVVKGGKLFK